MYFLYALGLAVCGGCNQRICPEHEDAILVHDLEAGTSQFFHPEHATPEARRHHQQDQCRVMAQWN